MGKDESGKPMEGSPVKTGIRMLDRRHAIVAEGCMLRSVRNDSMEPSLSGQFSERVFLLKSRTRIPVALPKTFSIKVLLV